MKNSKRISAGTALLVWAVAAMNLGASQCSPHGIPTDPDSSVGEMPDAMTDAGMSFPPECTFTELKTETITSFPTPTSTTQTFCDLPPANSGVTGMASMSAFLLAHEVPCGSCLLVTGAAASALVLVTEGCTDCDAAGQPFKLDQATFSAVTSARTGSASVQWQAVPCNPPAGISVAFENSGSSSMKARFVGVRFPISNASLIRGGGIETSLHRSESHRWTLSPENGSTPGPGPYNIALTSIFSERIVLQNVPLMNVSGNPWQAGIPTNQQFTQCRLDVARRRH